jgi:hypothetical protein
VRRRGNGSGQTFFAICGGRERASVWFDCHSPSRQTALASGHSRRSPFRVPIRRERSSAGAVTRRRVMGLVELLRRREDRRQVAEHVPVDVDVIGLAADGGRFSGEPFPLRLRAGDRHVQRVPREQELEKRGISEPRYCPKATMHVLFLDESGKPDQGGLFALGGVVVADADWPELMDLWQKVLRDAGWPLEREVKWYGIRKGEVPPTLGDAVFETLAYAPISCYVVVLDLDRGPAEFPVDEFTYFRSPEDVYATALMFLAERFQHLLAAEDDLGLIVVDSRFREDDARLRRFFADLTEDGTPYMKLGRIVEGLFLGPSRYSIGLQCADLVVAATLAAERGIGQGSGYLKRLLPRFAHHPATGEVEGVGLKHFPDRVPREHGSHRLFA